MPLSPLAGKPAPASLLIDTDALLKAYHDTIPDAANPRQRVSFGTSGHRGTALDATFTDAHIAAITQAICDYRRTHAITGPLMMGKDSHALSAPAHDTALEVLAANGVTVFVEGAGAFVPTPVISHAILTYNKGRTTGQADGIVITPSHNPPADGGFKYNPTNGGPADTDVTTAIQNRANQLLELGNKDVKRIPLSKATSADTTNHYDFVEGYVRELGSVIDMAAIKNAKLKLGVDPLGGAAVYYWDKIAEMYGLDLTVVNRAVDPTFSFMTVDHDGKIRMDCSSPYAMASLVGLKDQYRVAWGNDPDADRHGIVTPSAGLLNPNHYLAVAIDYLLTHRPQWPATAAVGKTLVSSAIIDRVVDRHKRTLAEVPVGFKWFAGGLYNGTYVFGGEESAGASFLKRDGTVWTTDKDGPLLGLLAAEITATTGQEPGEHYARLTKDLGAPVYTRIDAPASPEQKAKLKKLAPDNVKATALAGDPITGRMTNAPANNAPIDGLKVSTANGWFAARPSGTENVYKIYAESFKDESHLKQIVAEAQQIVSDAL
ncbi:MAG TPA: phosphoglucomutase (alpha-D-glucose-1,6-bisphosphate-dependent) [Tepidisphaeraceae bacterium]|nr:phosphoglucomutase (alpha-D-glucose-1,6-bisphosphate-dependent) [Tepidisphaeraceae bacterium]